MLSIKLGLILLTALPCISNKQAICIACSPFIETCRYHLWNLDELLELLVPILSTLPIRKNNKGRISI